MQSSDLLVPALAGDAHQARLDAYRAHLAASRDAILRELEEIAG
jgi:hypothetical protein